MSVGRDGASDAAAFIQAGIPAVEFGPAGDGHHGPEEWVSIASLARYRRSLGDFIRTLPMRLEERPARRAADEVAPVPAPARPARAEAGESVPARVAGRDGRGGSGEDGGLRAIEGGLA
jgi:succinyl-diaminopimelate desuccinylase